MRYRVRKERVRSMDSNIQGFVRDERLLAQRKIIVWRRDLEQLL